jgi:ribose 5-phosphate isomerase B
MHIYIGSDHGGFRQKEVLKAALLEEGMPVTDCGNVVLDETDDYPPIAAKVGHEVAGQPESLGILLCRSGEGMQMAANKQPGIRAALAWRPEVAAETRSDNDANVLVLPSDFVTDAEALAIVRSFLAARFSNAERHARRIAEMTAMEAA